MQYFRLRNTIQKNIVHIVHIAQWNQYSIPDSLTPLK